MSENYLEICSEKIPSADFAKYQLHVPSVLVDGDFRIVFATENDYCVYLQLLEHENNAFLSEYWIFKTPELIEKSRFIVKVLTVITAEKHKKYDLEML